MIQSDQNDPVQILSNLLDYSDDAIVTKDLNGIITSWNRGAEKLFGYLAAEAVGQSISLIIPEERKEELPNILERIRNNEIVDHYETERVRKDGGRLQISLVVSAIRNRQGVATGILKIAKDITVRKQAGEIQQQMAAIINFSRDAIYTNTLAGIITSWNDGAEHLYGYPKSVAIGKSVAMLIPTNRENEEPEIVERVLSGELINHYDTERITSNGNLVQVSLSVSSVKDPGGRITGVIKIARDVTVQKKAEELRNTLASIITYSDDAIISKTLEGTITSWNRGAEKIFGYSIHEAIGNHISIIIPEDRHAEENDIMSRVSRGEAIDHYVTERQRKDKTLVTVSLSVSPIKDSSDRIVGISHISRDITEQKKKEAEIDSLNKELEAFNYSVAHDLQSPLRTVIQYSQLILKGDSGQVNEQISTMLGKMLKKAKRMDVLIQDLLAFSQLGRQPFVKTHVDSMGLVNEVLNEVLDPHERNKINFRIESLEPAFGDRSMLKQVWENIIGNAVKYSGKRAEPVVEIGSRKEKGQITWFVRDNGEGFDPKYADRLFKAFQRLHNQSDFEGSGVGLAIVNQIIQKHEGKVWAEGRVNQGATFYFSLPASNNR